MRERVLRVVFASHSSSLSGGAERSLLDIVVALKKDGRIDPTVAVPAEGALAAALRAESIATVVLCTPHWTWRPRAADVSGSSVWANGFAHRVRRALAMARSSAAWLHWLQSQHPHVVVTNTATIPTPALASAVAGIPHVWWLHEFVTRDHGLDYAVGEGASQRMIGWLSTSVVVNSRAVRNHFSPPIPGGKVRVIYQGVSGFDAGPNGIHPSGLRVLLLGRLTPRKGASLALEAASILQAEATRIQLRLVGPIRPAYKVDLDRFVADHGLGETVQIAGATMAPRDEFAWANVVLMCSDDEAFGRVTVEALKSGRPVVGTRSGGTTELIVEGVNGLLFSPGSARELASVLGRMANEPGLLASMSDRAIGSVQDRFTMEGEVNAIISLLETTGGTRLVLGQGPE